MSRYTVNQDYTSQRDGQRFGPWAKGEVVELDDELAEWVERDSPGALSREREQKPAADRQHKGGRTR